MSAPDYDLVVIGGGSAGYAGASLAAQMGLKVAVVEGAAQAACSGQRIRAGSTR